jgi:hypothetical protein
MDVPPSLRNGLFFISLQISLLRYLFFRTGGLSLLLGFTTFNNLTARLTGAALAGIGVNSLLMSAKGIESYSSMLSLKIVWSVSAIAGIVITIAEGGPFSLYIFLSIFSVFSLVWIYYKRVVLKIIKAVPLQPQP